ncbi:hypothetical protein Y032_0512g2750 [Ancylostoma ceylanicum]|nr:hypothetical protein Y032_0512g2750 [Ancylostoma ceylanicum]
MSEEIFVWYQSEPSSQCVLCPFPVNSEPFEMASMRREVPWKSDENSMDSRSGTLADSVSTNQTSGVSHRQRHSGYREFTNSGESAQSSVSSSSIHCGTVTNSRYRRGGHYNSYDHSRRSRHRNNDLEVYRVQQQQAQYDSLMHPHSVNGLLRQHSWSGSNASLGSNRSRSSANRDHRSSACSRHGDDTENLHLRTSHSFSAGTKLDEFDDSNDNNVTYVAAGTAPVSTFRGSSCATASSVHTTAAPITTFAAPVIAATTDGHPLPGYPAALSLPIEQCDLRHFDQGVPLMTSGSEELSSAQLLFNQKGAASSRRCKDVTLLAKKVSDMQNFAARQHPAHSSATYFRHQMENERTALTLLSMISALQQRQAAGIPRYLPDLEGKEEEGVELSPAQQQQLQQLTAAQISSLLGA